MRKTYLSPTFVIYGDFADLTKTVQTGPGFDGPWTPSEDNPEHKCGNKKNREVDNPYCADVRS